MRILFWAAAAMELSAFCLLLFVVSASLRCVCLPALCLLLCVVSRAAEVVCCGLWFGFCALAVARPRSDCRPGPIGALGEQRAPRRGPAHPTAASHHRTGPCWSYRTANYVS